MKTEIFSLAILKRNKIKFLYGLNEVVIDPYYITRERSGKKVIYGKVYNTSEVKKFEYDKIANIRVLQNRFSPVIPIIPMAS
ncbi:MAG: hypothetical protein R6W90_06840 [Ignavibacteriaceae bacterium]